jgi:hypothetical protein
MSEVNPREEETKALSRIAGTHDGKLLLRKLYRVLEDVIAPSADHGALYENLGRRRFAQELLRELEQDHGIQREPSDPRPAPNERGQSVVSIRGRGARRPIQPGETDAKA